MKKKLLILVFAIFCTAVFTSSAWALDPMTNLLNNPSAENGITGWTIVLGSWEACNNTSWHSVRTGSYYFFPGAVDYPEMYQEIDLTSLAADIDNGIICGIGQGFIGGYSNDDDCRIIIDYKNSDGIVISSEDSDWITGPKDNWTQVDLPAYPGQVLPASTRTIRFRILGKRDAGNDCDSYFEDLSWMYRIISSDNNSPSVPVIAGPTETDTAVTESYSFIADDIDGDNISYQIDWGDSHVSDWSDYLAPATAYNDSHSWEIAGTYNIKARSRDSKGAVSDWSQSYAVTVTGEVSGSFTYGPYLQNVTQNAITIMWVTDNMVTPFIAYSTDYSYAGEAYGTCIAESGVYICKVRLTGLDTETTYNYIAYSGSTEAASQTFTTAPYRNASFGFCFWGDSQQEVTPSNAFFTAMANSDTDFGLSSGDIVQNTDWAYTKNPFLKYTLNKLARAKPIFIGYGNHDGSAASIERKFTEQPTTANYTFTYGNAHFTVLDYATGYYNTVPVAWLQAALGSQEAQSATWRFLVLHVPPYCERWIDGSSVLRASLVPLLEQYGVDMVFSGHTHEYERGFLNGVNYVISGCASYLDTVEVIVKQWDHMTIGGAHDIPPFTGGLAHGYTEIQITGNKLELKQHAYYPNGTYYGVMDNFSITKVSAACDFNFDGQVNTADLGYIADDWTEKPQFNIYLGQNFNDVKDATPSS
ncbi:MAG TPA: metallophosphoesterase family protein, partial [Sedimentisphaerales bacterium]|nr:metallophosphoesterase family protein [Sedimentisphaerales bacterium]